MSELVERASDYATRAHQRIDQRRKYSKQPYHVHLQAVARLVASVSDDEEAIAAAWLHDTVEDTPATLEEMARQMTEIGTRIEVEYQTNPSNLVNQEDKRVEDIGGQIRLVEAQHHLVDLLEYLEKKEGYNLYQGARKKCQCAMIVDESPASSKASAEPRMRHRPKTVTA